MTRLHEAFRAVRAKGGAPGVDNVTVQRFAENLEQNLQHLAEEVRGWNYKPKPVKRVRIPKPDGGERLIGIPSIRDRVLQYSLKMSLELGLEKEFSNHSYGFRPNRNQKQAIEAAKKLVNEGKEWVVDIDLEKFFDTINHDRIIDKLRQRGVEKTVLRIIAMTLRSGILENGELESVEAGTTQGSPLSPLLSNLILDELDKELEKRGLTFCRYADDCNIFVGSSKAANRVMTTITRFIEERLKLKVNREKSKVATAAMVKFLGMTIICGMIVISQKSMARAMEKVKELTPRRTHVPFVCQMEEVNRWYRGWSSYYEMGETPAQLASIEAHIRRRFRAQFLRGLKTQRNCYRRLRKMGVSRRTAIKSSWNSRGIWWRSHHSGPQIAWSIGWFRRNQMIIRSTDKLWHWKDVKLWVKFP